MTTEARNRPFPTPTPRRSRRRTRLVPLTALVLGIALAGGPPPAPAVETITYYHLDALGSPVAATGEQGNLKWREDYKPYGEKTRNQPAAATSARAYTGHLHDNDTGLTYMGARFYDPVVGRFMAVDPVAFTETNPHSFNPYGYANSNPYKFVDPDGRAAIEINLVGFGITVGEDSVSGQPFISGRLGLTGLSVRLYDNFDYSGSSETRLVGDCPVCDSGANVSKRNIGAGASINAGPVSVGGKIYNRKDSIIVVDHQNGTSSDYGKSESSWFKSETNVGWSRSDEKYGSVRGNRAVLGAGIDLEANIEKGWLIPWSRARSGYESIFK